MPGPFYVLGTAAPSPNFYGQLQDAGTPPTDAAATFGYAPGKLAANSFCKSFLGASAASATTQTTSYISGTSGPTKGTGATNTTAGDSFVTPAAYSGNYPSGTWTLTWNLRASTAGLAGQLGMRVWASVNASGASARELTAGEIFGAIVTLSTTVNTASTISWSAPAITLNNEFLFFQLEWKETTLGTANGDNAILRVGSSITTTTFLATIAGTLNANQAAQTVSAIGKVLVGGALNRTEVNDTLVAAGGPVVRGTLGLTELNDTLVAAGTSGTILPSWLPMVGNTAPSFSADLSTEGGANHYWANAATYGSAAAWIAAVAATVTRASAGSYTNAAGLLASAASNVPRFDHDPITLAPTGILLEGASTNLFLQSNDPTAGGWLNAGLPSTQVLTGPDGVANSAWKMTEDTGTQHVAINTTTPMVNGTVYTASFFIKNGSGRHVLLAESVVSGAAIEIDPSTGTIVAANGGVLASSIKPAPNGWWRASMTFVSNSTANAYLDFYSYNGGTSYTGDGVSWWGYYGGQAEPFGLASSYMPTTTAAGNRATDKFSSPWSALIGTYFVDLVRLEGLNSNADDYLSTDTSNHLIAEGAGLPNFVKTQDTLATLTVGCNDATVSENLFAVSGNAAGRSLCANAGSVTSDANPLISATPAELFLIDSSAGTPAYGNWRAFAAWPSVVATAAQLQTLTLPVVRGTLNVTELNETLVAAGGPRVGATLNLTELPDTLVAAGTVATASVTGTLNVNQAAQTLSASGGPIIGGTLNANQAPQTIAAAGWSTSVGTLNIGQANQTIVAHAGPIVGAALNANQAPQTVVAHGGPVVAGVLNAQQANQTISALGTVAIGSTLNVAQASQTLLGHVDAVVGGHLNVAQAPQTIAANGSVFSGITGALNLPQAPQTLGAAGTVPIATSGTLNVAQAPQTVSAHGGPIAGATLNVAQAAEVLVAHGAVIVAGQLSVEQANQAVVAHGVLTIVGTLNVAQAPNTLSAFGTDVVSGTLNVAQADQTLRASASALTGEPVSNYDTTAKRAPPMNVAAAKAPALSIAARKAGVATIVAKRKPPAAWDARR